MAEPSDVPALPALIAAAESGDSSAAENLFAVLYAELHRVARRELRRPGAPPNISVTTLLHEAYIDMAGRADASFPDRARFMGYAARVMRGLVIDHVRSHHAQKRGGLFEITSLTTDVAANAVNDVELSRIADAIDDLDKVDSALAEVVNLKFFCGFTFGEIAAMRGVSERTVQRQWDKARILLHRGLRGAAVL